MRAPPGGQLVETLVSTTYYYYYDWSYDEQAYVDHGNVTRVVTKKENPPLGQPQFEATRLVYARNGRTVTYGLGETYDTTPGGNVTGHEVTYVHEYRYDAARQRYLKRQLDPETLEEVESLWTDYDGDQPYGDFTVSGGAATEVRSFQPGLAKVEPWRNWDDANTQYYHADMIGTTRNMSDSGGTGVSGATYTAFGERMSGSMGGPGDRYGYAGASGYQGDEELPFLHVGHRYYDPAIGRFLQRDPIGIRGGLNVYQYVEGAPTMSVDPSGRGKKWDWVKKKAKEAWEVIKKLPPYLLPSPPIPADAAPDAADAYTGIAKRNHILKDHEDATPDPKCPTCKRLTPKKRRRKGPPTIGCGAHTS